MIYRAIPSCAAWLFFQGQHSAVQHGTAHVHMTTLGCHAMPNCARVVLGCQCERSITDVIKHFSWYLLYSLLSYVGQEVLNWEMEKLFPGVTMLVRLGYSLGYLISLRGAKKLRSHQPFQKMLPVDEYLPILFNMHPE